MVSVFSKHFYDNRDTDTHTVFALQLILVL